MPSTSVHVAGLTVASQHPPVPPSHISKVDAPLVYEHLVPGPCQNPEQFSCIVGVQFPTPLEPEQHAPVLFSKYGQCTASTFLTHSLIGVHL